MALLCCSVNPVIDPRSIWFSLIELRMGVGSGRCREGPWPLWIFIHGTNIHFSYKNTRLILLKI